MSILQTGYHARVRSVPHPYMDTPVGFVTEVYFVPPMPWWKKFLVRIGCAGLFEPERVYQRRFDLPGMPLEVEQAYVRHNLDMQLGDRAAPRWWLEDEHSPSMILLNDDQLYNAMHTWKLIVERLQDRARTHAREALADFVNRTAAG